MVQGHSAAGPVRLAGEIFFGKQRDSLNEILVDAGLAWWDYRVGDVFELNQKQARKARRGLWKHRAPVAPWEFGKPAGKPRKRLHPTA